MKKNSTTRMSKFLSGLKDFLNKRVLRFMLFSLLFKKNTTLWLPGFFLVCVSYKKNKHEKIFCPDKKKLKILLKFFSRKIILSKPKKVSNQICRVRKKSIKKIQNNYTITNFQTQTKNPIKYESSNPHHIILLSSFKFLYMYILLSYMKDTTLGSVHYIKKYINLELKLCNSINLYLSSTTTIWRVIIINNFIFCQKKNIQNKSCLLIVLFC